MKRNLAGITLALIAAAAPCSGALTPPRDVAFIAGIDGTEQFYMEMLPAGFDQNKKYDLIIGLHGHGSDRKQFATDKRPECAAFREFAAKHGMIAVTPDYRAKTSWMGPKAEADLVQIINALKSKYQINRVFITGGSMGGTSALTFAALHPDMIDGVAAMNGHADHLEYENFQDAIAESFGGSKAEIPEEYKKRSAGYWPEKLTMPVAFTVSGNDTSVPPGSALRLAAALKKLNRKVMVINRPQGGHATNFDDGIAVMEFMLNGIAQEPAAASAATAVNPAPAASNATANSGKGGIFFADTTPADRDAKGTAELGLKFYVEKTGKIKAFCFYQARSETGPHVFHLWSSDGKPLLAVNVPETQVTGWIEVPLPESFQVAASTEFIVSYACNKSYVATPDVFAAPVKRDGIMAVAGLYSFDGPGRKAPDKTYKNMNYFLDVIYEQ